MRRLRTLLSLFRGISLQTRDAGHHIRTLNLKKCAKRQDAPGTDDSSIQAAVKTYDKALRAAKKKSWRIFCGEVNGFKYIYYTHLPDCIVFFQRMLVIRWGHLDFPRVILQTRLGRAPAYDSFPGLSAD
jgi:hypothetical protein